MGGENGCDGSLGTYSNCLVDTDDGKQKKEKHDDFPWTENKEVFCFTSSLSSTRSFDWNLESINICTNSQFISSGKVYIWLPVWEFTKTMPLATMSQQPHACWELRNWSPSTWLVTVVCRHFTLAWVFVSHACTM